MTSDAVFKHTEKNSFSARQKLAIFICLFISAAILFTVFVYDRHSTDNSGAKEKTHVDEEPDPEPEPEDIVHDHDNDDHGDDEDYWMDDDDIHDELAGY